MSFLRSYTEKHCVGYCMSENIEQARMKPIIFPVCELGQAPSF